MGGHVNMMDDVLISNLPPEHLRSALRTLVSLGSVTQLPFVQHIRQRLTEEPPELTPPERLFADDDRVTSACRSYVALTRCIFSSKLAIESLTYLQHFVSSISDSGVRWSVGSDLDGLLEEFGGDIVQAVQSLKESRPETTESLEQKLSDLQAGLDNCRAHCGAFSLNYPFTRAARQVRDVMGFLYPQHRPSTTSAQAGSTPIELTLPTDRALEKFTLGSFEVPRLFNGLWQLSSPAWGSGTAEKQDAALAGLAQSGFTAADMADHYGDAELIYGDFRNKLDPKVGEQIYAATKWCIFGPLGHPVTDEWVLGAVKERCRRLGGRVELLQFHWYDYGSKEYLDILEKLVGITQSHPQLLGAVGLCNFDSDHTQEVCEFLLAKTGNVGIVSNQIQFSLLDSRPLRKMCTVCAKYGIRLLTYGSFCGGLLSSKWLGQPAPELYSESAQLTPSQRKYFDMIRNWGTWEEYQGLLRELSATADRYGVSLTNVATRWVLQQPQVGAVIVGTRLGVTAHGNENLSVFKFSLSDADLDAINAIALGQDGQKAAAVWDKLGDCGNEYRAMH
ncbi:aldo/keto reductase [Xylariaceae sp. FL0804]|nr:aldo/keto reductase [Xylariaceae sp. FL0804]